MGVVCWGRFPDSGSHESRKEFYQRLRERMNPPEEAVDSDSDYPGSAGRGRLEGGDQVHDLGVD